MAKNSAGTSSNRSVKAKNKDSASVVQMLQDGGSRHVRIRPRRRASEEKCLRDTTDLKSG